MQAALDEAHTLLQRDQGDEHWPSLQTDRLTLSQIPVILVLMLLAFGTAEHECDG